jgi:molecular chaperone GrpE
MKAEFEEGELTGPVGPGAGPAVAETAAGAPVDVVPTAGQPLADQPPLDQPPLDQPPLDQPPLDQPPLDLIDVARQRDEYLDTLRRVQADFDNYRKRVERQQREMADNAATALVKKLLLVLDTADLALAHGGGEDVKQIEATLFDVLSKEGLERIMPEGQAFDPEVHDAVAHEPVEGEGAPELPEVSEVLRAGYRWKGRVVRPAMVKVRG